MTWTRKRASTVVEDKEVFGLEGLRIIVTAGPTREYLDPVRFLSNPSTGKMGFAIAAEAARRGLAVTLVAGPVSLKTPRGVERVDVTSAREMLKAVKAAVKSGREAGGAAPVLISSAAIADWRPAKCARQKLKKREMEGTLRLVRNPDILKSVGRAARRIGFAAETTNVVSEAQRKCREKGLEFIVANDVTEKGSGFGTDTDRVVFVFPDGTARKFPLMTKRGVARKILDEVLK